MFSLDSLSFAHLIPKFVCNIATQTFPAWFTTISWGRVKLIQSSPICSLISPTFYEQLICPKRMYNILFSVSQPFLVQDNLYFDMKIFDGTVSCFKRYTDQGIGGTLVRNHWSNCKYRKVENNTTKVLKMWNVYEIETWTSTVHFWS